MGNLKVFRPIGDQDPTVVRAMEISKNFRVLPYVEVEKRLDAKINYTELLQKYGKGV